MNLDNLISYANVRALTRSEKSINAERTLLHRMREGVNNDSVGSSMLSMIQKSTGIQSVQTKQEAQDMIQKNVKTLRDRKIAKSTKHVGSSNYDTFDGIREQFKKTINVPNASKSIYSTFMSRNNDATFNSMINKAKSDAAKKANEATSNTAKNVLADTKIATKVAGKEAAEGAAKKVGKSLLDKAVDMKIPQIALGVGVTAWLVNKLSDSRGQQSNAQLYGQQGY